MEITADSRIYDIAATSPATIKVFQHHQIDFCCGGRIPVAEACARRGIDTDTLLEELRAARLASADWPNWEKSTLMALIAHIQQRYHEPLRQELPRLSTMLSKVVERHGARLGDSIVRLQATFERLRGELLEHMAKEDAVLFPAIRASEAGLDTGHDPRQSWRWICAPVSVMEAEHASAGAALAVMRELTNGYTPPDEACPTFRGLYHGLSEFERDMHLHVHLENNVLFPRAVGLARMLAAREAGVEVESHQD